MMRTECGLGDELAAFVQSLLNSAEIRCSAVELPMRVIFEAIEETICLRNLLSGNALSQQTGLGGRQLLSIRMNAVSHDPKALQHRPDLKPTEEIIDYSNPKTRKAIQEGDPNCY